MEKFQTFRRGKVILFCASFLTLMIFIFVACRNELNIEQPLLNEIEKPLSSEIKEIKDWFDSQKNSAYFEPIRKKEIVPRWQSAVMINNVVEVLFTEHGRFGSPMIEKGLRYLGRQRLRFDKNGDSRMFVNT